MDYDVKNTLSIRRDKKEKKKKREENNRSLTQFKGGKRDKS